MNLLVRRLRQRILTADIQPRIGIKDNQYLAIEVLVKDFERVHDFPSRTTIQRSL